MNYNGVSPNSNEDNKVTNNNAAKEKAYWDSFYTKHELPPGSSFFEAVSAHPALPNVVIDIGCGDGRDSFAFARAGRRVLGLDRSSKGVDHGRNRALSAGMESSLAFEVCDVSSTKDLASKLDMARKGSADGRVCIYMRFFLHSIDGAVQDSMMETISARARGGDFFAAEFRTDKDENQAKAFGNTHFRRYQNGDDFSKKLQKDYGWDNIVLETESQGLAPYMGEDPVLYRVLARREV